MTQEDWKEKYGIGDNFAELFEIEGMKGYDKGEDFGDPDEAADASIGRFTYTSEPQDKLDLHGYTVVETERLVKEFLEENRSKGFAFVLIVVGKGRNSEGGQPKLRPAVTRLLNDLADNKRIRSYSSAKPIHGGFGAIYVYLR